MIGGFLLLAAPLAATPLTLSLRAIPGTPLDAVRAKVTLAPAGGQKDAERRSLEVTLPEPAVFDVPEGSAWKASIDAPGYWAPSKLVVAGATAPAAALELRRAGTITGTVRTPPGQATPAELTVRFRSAPGVKPPVVEEAAEVCPISSGRFRCTVPAGSLDLRLRARGYLTHYRWGASVPPRKALALGNLDLKPGAQVVGWIEVPDRAFHFSEVSVEMAPQTMGMVGAESRIAALLQKEPVNSRGFFELTGLAPGSYRLVVRHPRFAPKVVMPVEVRAGTETELHPLVLEPPLHFEARVDPPLDPYGQRWSLELTLMSNTAGMREVVKHGAATAEGVFRATDLEPGRYVLSVEGAYRSRWSQEEIDIGQDAAPHEIHLPFVQVEGEVRLGGKPLFALLWFGGHQAAQRVAAKSDADGRFSVVLPEQEHWRVEVFNTLIHVDGVVPNVPVHRSPGESVARVTIDLPNTVVRGEVVDEEGKTMRGARVETNGPAAGDATTDEQGRFEMIGVAPGDWTLQAYSPDRSATSEEVSFHLDKEPVEGLKLVLRKDSRLAGMIVDPDGQGVPGALILAQVDDPALGFEVRSTYSDIGGQFELHLPARTEGLRLTVLPPGFGLTQLRIDAQHADPLIVPVSPVAGTLTLRYAGGERLAKTTRLVLTSLAHDFPMPSLATLARWAEANGASTDDPNRLSIPMLEPGPYTACFPEEAPFKDDGTFKGGMKNRCVSGTLGALGELVLNLEVKAPAKQKGSAAEGTAPPPAVGATAATAPGN